VVVGFWWSCDPGRGRARRSPRIDTTGERALTGGTFLTENCEEC
jgi:hypothetical protein